MTRPFLAAALALVLAGPASAECYADYKAKPMMRVLEDARRGRP